jgi:uncharacterized membrane-anchored protein
MSTLGGLLRRELNPLMAAIICSVVLVGTLVLMIQGRAAILREGTEIVLKTAPVDPRDLMRGDYVRLRYEAISSVNGALLEEVWPEQDSFLPLWLTLAPGEDGLGQIRAVTLEKPENASVDAVYLRSDPVRLRGEDNPRTGSMTLALTFGIERYYVPEGEGLEIEAARNEGRTTVAIRVSEAGVAQIARLMIDGKTLYEEPLY